MITFNAKLIKRVGNAKDNLKRQDQAFVDRLNKGEPFALVSPGCEWELIDVVNAQQALICFKDGKYMLFSDFLAAADGVADVWRWKLPEQAITARMESVLGYLNLDLRQSFGEQYIGYIGKSVENFSQFVTSSS